MKALLIIAIVLAVLLFLLLSPVKLKITYEETTVVKLKYLLFRHTLFPYRKKQKEQAETRPAETSEKEKASFSAALKKNGLYDFICLLKEAAVLVGETMGRISKFLVFKKFFLSVAVASDDAADTAVLYGRLCAVIYPLLGIIIGNFANYKDIIIEIYPDFKKEKTTVQLEAHVKIPLVFLIWTSLKLLIKGVGLSQRAREKGYI